MNKTVFVFALLVLVIMTLSPLGVAAVVPMAHGTFTLISVPSFAYPGQRIHFLLEALNDGSAPGWFSICIVHFNNIGDYYPDSHWGWKEIGVQCSAHTHLMPGEYLTFESTKWLMQSIPSSLFHVPLFVQQDEPVVLSDGSLANLSVDDDPEIVIVNPSWEA